MITYSCIVIIVNVEILNATNNHTLIGSLVFFLSIAGFVMSYYIMNQINRIDELYHTFFWFAHNPLTYFVIVFVIGSVNIYQKAVFIISKLKDIYMEINLRMKLLRSKEIVPIDE